MKRHHHEVLVVGGGWAGVSAAIAARKAGADVAVCERTDMLLGAGLVGGIMRNNGRFTAAEEAIAMGFGDLFELTDATSRHKGIAFPGHAHASLYDVLEMEPAVRRLLIDQGIALYFGKRITRLRSQGGAISTVYSEDDDSFSAASFVDTTGSSGPMGLCQRFGNGCATCIQRCPTFGPRISLTSLLSLPEFMCVRRKSSYGAMSGSCKIYKETLAKGLREELDSAGVAIIPLPGRLVNTKKLEAKVCQQYALPEYADSVILLDTGHAKLMTSYFPIGELRTLPGLENARFADPLGGSRGNSIRLTAVSPRDRTMKVYGSENLFVGGERAGVCVGHTEAIITGALAGRNAALLAKGRPLSTIPLTLATGDYISQSAVNQDGAPAVAGSPGLGASFTFAGSVYFNRMRDLDLYTIDVDAVRRRAREARAEGLFLS
ncbi:MAG: FAD-dependent oxidoreductase [Bacillota bacterium]